MAVKVFTSRFNLDKRRHFAAHVLQSPSAWIDHDATSRNNSDVDEDIYPIQPYSHRLEREGFKIENVKPRMTPFLIEV